MRNGPRNGPLIDRYSGSGIDSPDRFAGPIPHPHPISPRHVSRNSGASTPRSSSPDHDERRIEGENGDRDDIRCPRAARESSKSKIPRNRDVDVESARTPRAYELAHVQSSLAKKLQHMHSHAPRLVPAGHHHHHAQAAHAYTHTHPRPPARQGLRHMRSLSVDGGSRRAFAVWGHDESDSNASDSDSYA